MHGGRGQREPGRYALTESENGHVWGVCAEVEGLFREPGRAIYELFGWVPDGAEVRGWVGRRVWLVPDDKTLDPWLLEDAESLPGRPTDALVLTGMDDYMGPPERQRAPIRVHDRYRWLGSCREFTRVLPHEQAAPSLAVTTRSVLLPPSGPDVSPPRTGRAWPDVIRRRGGRRRARLRRSSPGIPSPVGQRSAVSAAVSGASTASVGA